MSQESQYNTRLNFVLALVRKGLSREKIVSKFVDKWGTSVKTADRVLKKARDVHNLELKTLEDKRQAELSRDLVSEIQAEIATEIEIDLILTKFVRGDIKIQEYLKGKKVIRDIDPGEIIAAADKLYKRKGSYAPTRIAATDSEGKDKEPAQGITLPNGATITIN